MKEKFKSSLICFIALILLFGAFTLAVMKIDVQSYTPAGATGGESAEIGFSHLNFRIFELNGGEYREIYYKIADYLGCFAIAIGLGFAFVGLRQLIKRKSFFKIDLDIYALGIMYLAMLACYIFFEIFIVNFRPVMIDGELEASFPSSHTVMTVFVMMSAISQLDCRLKNRKLFKISAAILVISAVATVAARLISGAHWLTDIIGGLIISAALVALYNMLVYGFNYLYEKRHNGKS